MTIDDAALRGEIDAIRGALSLVVVAISEMEGGAEVAGILTKAAKAFFRRGDSNFISPSWERAYEESFVKTMDLVFVDL